MRSGVAIDDGNARVNASFTADPKRINVNVDGPSMAVLRSGWTSITVVANHSFEFEKPCQLFVGSNDESLSVVAVRVRREKHATSRTNVGRNRTPMPNQVVGADEIRAPSYGRRPRVSRAMMFSYSRQCRCATRLLDQSVKWTSNACAPREEARPSVSPERYMTTPFWFVSLACILPSIRVSPRLMPW